MVILKLTKQVISTESETYRQPTLEETESPMNQVFGYPEAGVRLTSLCRGHAVHKTFGCQEVHRLIF